jgi:hypothetical protein
MYSHICELHGECHLGWYPGNILVGVGGFLLAKLHVGQGSKMYR